MADKRLRGEQVEIKLVENGAPVDTWRALASGSIECKNDILEEEFLGETAPRFDAIFKGWGLSLELQMESAAEETFVDAVQAKNQRRAGAPVRFDIVWTNSYPTGQVTLRVLKDVEFGAFKIDAGGRSDYVKLSFDGSCSSANRVDT